MMRIELSLMWDWCFDSVSSADYLEKPVHVVSELNIASVRLLLTREAQTRKREASQLVCRSGWFHK